MDNTQNQREIRGCKRRKLLANDSDDVSEAQENQPNHFDTLPDEIHLEILKKVQQSQLDSLALVCSRFSRIIEDRSLWKEVVCESSKLRGGDLGKWMRRQVQHLNLYNVTIPSSSLLPALEATQASWSLKEVYLDQVTIFPNDLLKIFDTCKQLTTVYLEWVRVNKDVLVALSENKNIEILRLCCVQGLQPVGLEILLKNLRKLQELYIDLAPVHLLHLNSEVLDEICYNLAPSLSELTLSSGCDLLMDFHVAAVVRNCPLLQSFKVGYGRILSERSTESLRNLKHLRELAMQRCSYIRPATFLAMANEMESLVKLDIYHDVRDGEERRAIEELFGVNTIEYHILYCVGTFKTSFGVVNIKY